MKKVMCIKCGQKRGRRECIKFGGFICGDCCSTTQLNYTCPKSCSSFGKLNSKDYSDKINALLEIGTGMKESNPHEAIKIFDRVIKLDEDNCQGYIEKGTAYENLGQFDESAQCFEKAYSINGSGNTYLDIVSANMKAGRYKKALEMLEGLNNKPDSPQAYYLFGECSYMLGRFEDAVENMKKLLNYSGVSNIQRDKAYITLARSYLMTKNTDLSVQASLSIGEGHDNEKNDVLENAYFAGGRMYELLKLIDSIKTPGGLEKYMLLQCCLVLEKDRHGNTVDIIDDILNHGYYNNNSYREAWLIALKIKLLFKEFNMKQAYEVFTENQDEILKYTPDISDCAEACCLIAFFTYSIDREKALSLYSDSTGSKVSEFLIDELYNAFNTMDISPYITARSIEKSIELMKDGRRESFNRTAVAADLLFENGEYSQAEVFYRRLFDESKPDAVTMYRIAVCLINQAKFDEAGKMLARIISQTRFIPGVNPAMVRCSLETGTDWMEYYKAVEFEKLDFNTIYELAGQLQEKGHFDKAGYLYSIIVEKFNGMDVYSRKMVYHNMAFIYRNLHEYKRAIELAEQIPAEYRGPNLLVDLGCLYSDAGDIQKSLKIFQGIDKGYHEELINMNTGILQMKLGNFDEALKCFYNSVNVIKDNLKSKDLMYFSECRDCLEKVYRSISLCCVLQGNFEDALLNCERALNINGDAKTLEIISFVQGKILHPEIDNGGMKKDAANLLDSCAAVSESFTDELRDTLDNLLIKVYGTSDRTEMAEEKENTCIGDFIENEMKVYSRNRESIERSEGTFQRYIDNLMNSFEKRVIKVLDDKFPSPPGTAAPFSDVRQYCNELVEFSNMLFDKLQYSGMPGYIYVSLIPVYKAVKILSRSVIRPYYKKNIDKLPVPLSPEEFSQIGIYCHKSYDDTFYRIDFPFDISCSKYLFEINCHPGLRDNYFNFKRHYMPWSKLLWMVSGIKKKWDIIDDVRACGLLLLFYCGYKNYLNIESEMTREDIINLSGDLIQLNNERDFNIRSMLKDDYEFECNNQAEKIRDIALRCMQGILKIKKTEE